MSEAYILVVDDEPDIRGLVQEILQDEGYRVAVAENGECARKAMRERRPDLALLDIWMPDVDGITLLKEWGESGDLPCPIVMMSGHGTVETAVEATRLGAYDFLEKPLSLAKLLLTVERALETDRLQQENLGLRSQSSQPMEPVGKSAAMHRLREQVRRIAVHDTWVLITGEPGSGRETFAHFLHSQSPRRANPFVKVAVSAIPRENAARELFGSEQDGQIRYGIFEQARGGTLFLDEVADMDEEAQSHLLGALEKNAFVRVGGSEPVSINARIVAATQENLAERVRQGEFREELFFHLNVVPLHIPSLREHAEDISELLCYYVDHFVIHERLPYRHFDVRAQNFMRNYPWPGNVRELKNLVQRLMILGSSEEVGLEEVQTALTAAVSEGPGGAPFALNLDQPLRQAREEFEKIYLEYQLDKYKGNVSRVAQEVGMERTHLYRKMRAVGIEIKDRKP
ncbi:MAG: sigma-54 dependent transcriptional regulator [Gammaproteobacteria bacterium]|nr:sigma-54 dependent transcriptional regulator [Gammaproteobacteria bacterium]MBU1656327.1 sigma-54 dependent transcriptional regulator [Gammaproteobacteria bacterium]MBU1959892.1 sigma-54 dependent transcriptional regulator [Gammaproteobacteria bacterium]